VNIKPIVIISGEPNSIFSEILIKAIRNYRNSKPIILIGSYDLITKQLNILNIKYKFNLIDKKFNNKNISNKKINIIDINYNFKAPFETISTRSNLYLKECFNLAILLSKNYSISGIINGPVSKKYFLNEKFPGVTEYLAYEFKIKKYAMLIYNKKLSVAPITTHMPIRNISQKLSKKLIIDRAVLINNFYIKYIKKKPKIAILGLNPHCENFSKFNEEKEIIEPAIKVLQKKKLLIFGPLSADSIFMKNNREKFDVIIGMYHDQVLTPIKALFNFDSINITLGLPLIRVSPDHGPNFSMVKKNKSNPKSLLESIKFLDRLN
jgi:4-hydroxythreonine-4-phosphate dehydrogenase